MSFSNIDTMTEVSVEQREINDVSSTILQIKDLNVYVEDHHILKNINLEIPKNRVTVLLGPSGCGKTTLLKCMNKLTDLYRELEVSGSILIDGDDILNTDRKSVV